MCRLERDYGAILEGVFQAGDAMKTALLIATSFVMIMFLAQAGIIIAGILCISAFIYVSWLNMKASILAKRLKKNLPK